MKVSTHIINIPTPIVNIEGYKFLPRIIFNLYGALDLVKGDPGVAIRINDEFPPDLVKILLKHQVIQEHPRLPSCYQPGPEYQSFKELITTLVGWED